MGYLWLKAFHVIFVVTWFAGLFYLPRLFVYHTEAIDTLSIERFKIMEHKLFYIIMQTSALLTLITGLSLLYVQAWQAYKSQGWLHAKLLLVFLLIGYHVHCWIYLRRFAKNQNRYSGKFYRIFNEVPAFFLVTIVILVVVKPF